MAAAASGAVSAPAVASLAMYPFPSLRAATDDLWGHIRRHLGWGPAMLEWAVLPPEVWYDDHLLCAQACGWPLVTSLSEVVLPVGTFDYDVPGAQDGTYRSVIVGRDSTPLEQLVAGPGVVVAVNGLDSLSGWVSLQHVWGGVPEHVVRTGAHLESVRAVVEGHAELASIDAVSWFHFTRDDPRLTDSLHVLGSGPRVPCLPLVVGRRHAHLLPELRAAVAAAVADPSAQAACSTLRIRSFIALDRTDYTPLRSLLP